MAFALTLTLTFVMPLHAATRDELKQTRQEMEDARAKKERLAEQTRRIESELKELQRELVRSAAGVQKSELRLTSTEKKLRVLSNQMDTKETALKEREENLAALIDAALALSRTPPEAIMVMPGDTAVKAAGALKMTAHSIRQEAAGIRLQMEELKRLEGKVSRHRSDFSQRQEDLDKEREALARRLEERKALREKISRETEEESKRLNDLAKKADGLEALLVSLEAPVRSKGKSIGPDATGRAPQGEKGKLRPFAAAKGNIRPPLAGDIVRSFGERGKNETSKGLIIAARARAQVTAPYDGEVVFTGPFLNYGRMVIIRHSDDFHTLLSGLSAIDVKPGEFLLEGEPIGAMGDSESTVRLYVELRKNNHPVDPVAWMNGIHTTP